MTVSTPISQVVRSEDTRINSLRREEDKENDAPSPESNDPTWTLPAEERHAELVEELENVASTSSVGEILGCLADMKTSPSELSSLSESQKTKFIQMGLLPVEVLKDAFTDSSWKEKNQVLQVILKENSSDERINALHKSLGIKKSKLKRLSEEKVEHYSNFGQIKICNLAMLTKIDDFLKENCFIDPSKRLATLRQSQLTDREMIRFLKTKCLVKNHKKILNTPSTRSFTSSRHILTKTLASLHEDFILANPDVGMMSQNEFSALMPFYYVLPGKQTSVVCACEGIVFYMNLKINF